MIAKGGGHDTEPRRRPCVRKLSGEPLDRTDLPVPLAKSHAFEPMLVAMIVGCSAVTVRTLSRATEPDGGPDAHGTAQPPIA